MDGYNLSFWYIMHFPQYLIMPITWTVEDLFGNVSQSAFATYFTFNHQHSVEDLQHRKVPHREYSLGSRGGLYSAYC